MDVVVVGVGEMGGVFATAFLRAGRSVHPVRRGHDLEEAADAVEQPEVVMVAVAESDLHDVLASFPPRWRSAAGLLQNELLPRDWRAHDIETPTVAVVWFEKKRGQDVKVIRSSPVAGPAAGLLVTALGASDIPAHVVTAERLLVDLVVKNCYILTANIAGLETGGTVSELWGEHRVLAEAVAGEVIAIQEHLAGSRFDHEELVAEMVAAFEADPEHGTTGRTAKARLARALEHAGRFGVQVPTLREIGQAGGIAV